MSYLHLLWQIPVGLAIGALLLMVCVMSGTELSPHLITPTSGNILLLVSGACSLAFVWYSRWYQVGTYLFVIAGAEILVGLASFVLNSFTNAFTLIWGGGAFFFAVVVVLVKALRRPVDSPK